MNGGDRHRRRETGFPDAERRQTPNIKSPPPGAAEVTC